MLFLAVALLFCTCASGENANAVPAAETGLVIDAALLGEEPSFIDWEQNGTAMQLIARKDAEGNVYLAFNTCQSCAGSPYAWFEYLGGGMLQCQQGCGMQSDHDHGVYGRRKYGYRARICAG